MYGEVLLQTNEIGADNYESIKNEIREIKTVIGEKHYQATEEYQRE